MRFIGRVLGMAVVVLAAVWLGLWWWTESQMQDGFANWAARMQNQGNITVSYGRMNRGYSPLAASVTLTNMQITVQPNPARPPVSVTLPSFGMEIDAADPQILHYNLPGQITINTPRASVAATFGNIALTQQIDLDALANKEIDPFKASDFSASNINLLASGGSLLLLHIDSINSHATINRAAGASGSALNWTDDFKGISLSPLLTRLGSVPFGGSVTELAVSMNLSGPVPANWDALVEQFNALPAANRADRGKIMLQAARAWAAGGGNASASLKLVAGPSTLNASGNVKFDAKAQPSGTADVTADHLDAFSAAITGAYPQTQDRISAIQAQLSPYLSSSDSGGQTLGMHVVYGAGTVAINGEKVSDLPPIDWDALENPPAPTPQAPGDGSGAAAQPPVVSGAQ
ncbi:hypothetical protein GCM10010909_03990 [Acidocella aquatica]|uniref:DUF2125 domain-containing protein n=1 Tax=Acidocella aquatica TaxID=1922313 RepID=A0ABQ5ZZT5_9PROT|nr:DUF2125 domain-containing protein [Acidocella aquatica]GLR65721.1 hypothetical protein GCM10010909_03990 [Acidocella aquatica]